MAQQSSHLHIIEHMFDDVKMDELRDRYRVESPKGPYVGYGVFDVKSGHFLTEVDLKPEDALTIAASLMVAAAPRDVRQAEQIRAVLPPRAIALLSQPGFLAAWAASHAGWLGFVLTDGEMRSQWAPALDLEPRS